MSLSQFHRRLLTDDEKSILREMGGAYQGGRGMNIDSLAEILGKSVLDVESWLIGLSQPPHAFVVLDPASNARHCELTNMGKLFCARERWVPPHSRTIQPAAAGLNLEPLSADASVASPPPTSTSDRPARERVIPSNELEEFSEFAAVTFNESGTKLDLAQAYFDMGVPQEARALLEEVTYEGDPSQQAMARRMLRKLDSR
jgi:FimV-like protein